MSTNQLLGKYEILEELGRGGFGVVYKAQDTVLDVVRAVKVLHPALVADISFLPRFKQEARLAAKLEHPNLVPVYDFGEHDGRFYLAMKYMPGGSLKDRLQRGKGLSESETVSILEQVGRGITFAHEKGIVHRDLKPGNILFDEDGAPRVSDMGFAKAMAGSSSASLSTSGMIVGTPAYIAPEIWRGKPAGLASDIYSLGCVLYEMLTSEVLFDGESPADVMTQHVLDDAGWLIQAGGKSIPAPILRVLEKSLAKNPNDRFGSAVEFTRTLAKAVRVEEGQSDPVIDPVEEEGPNEPPEIGLMDSTADLSAAEVNIGIYAEPVTLISEIEDGSTLQPQPRQVAQELRPELISQPIKSKNSLPKWLIWPALATVVLLLLWVSRPWWPRYWNASESTGARTSGARPYSGEIRIRQVDGMEQVFVPAGSFTMGSDNGTNEEKPIHKVYLDSYWIDKYEVTNAEYELCVKTGKCDAPSDQSSYTRSNYYNNPEYSDYPVINVSWCNAQDSCDWVDGRLPKEAEWEKAARGEKDAGTYPWGEGIDAQKANFCDINCSEDWKDSNINDGYADTAPVGSYPAGASPYGVLDMAGNVWEWVADGWDANYYSSKSIWNNPAGPSSDVNRVMRGLSFFDPTVLLLPVSFRAGNEPVLAHYSLGFRCANSE